MPAIHDPIQFFSGDTWQIEFSCSRSNGLPLDLTGASVEWSLDTYDGGVNLLTRTVGNGIAITNPTGGKCDLTVADPDTALIAPGFYRDRLRVTTRNGVT